MRQTPELLAAWVVHPFTHDLLLPATIIAAMFSPAQDAPADVA
jgi:hypothetical protein